MSRFLDDITLRAVLQPALDKLDAAEANKLMENVRSLVASQRHKALSEAVIVAKEIGELWGMLGSSAKHLSYHEGAKVSTTAATVCENIADRIKQLIKDGSSRRAD